ncbi:hypothetical protein T10_239 [Trichinella papuae]|uniref:Uncharacterized protein n=1 Tax=Trichinella papuae TaxID=268474 RepID=A0A0V1MHL0_9BILA|nr:hypothetical protein T10_239 [Trichinella papuae]
MPSQNQPLSSLTRSLKISQQTHVAHAQLIKYRFLGVVTSDFGPNDCMISFSYQSRCNTELKLVGVLPKRWSVSGTPSLYHIRHFQWWQSHQQR